MHQATLRKWRAIFDVYFSEGLAYRASGIIWIMTDMVTAITMPLVWARSNGGGSIAGYSTSDFVLYYLCMLLLGSFVTSHIMWELAQEIKEGQFSLVLLRPISFYQLTFFRNLPWRMIRTSLFLPIFLLMLYAYRGFLGEAKVFLGMEFWVSLVLGHFVSFCFVTMMAMIALFTEEAMSIFELYYGPMLFLSGQLFPVSLLPEWAVKLARYLPFYYTTGAPTEILIQRVKGPEMHQVLLIQFAWAIACYVLGKLLWNQGIKRYSAVGM